MLVEVAVGSKRIIKTSNNGYLYQTCKMRSIATIIFCLLFTISEGKIITLKFLLINDVDSSSIGLKSIIIKPIKSYLVEEMEHHDNSSKRYDFITFRFYYNSELSCNIFEYDSKDYPFDDIYLKIESDSFYYHRKSQSDYDEENCVHLRADNNKINTIYISPYRFINVTTGNFINKNICFNVTLTSIFEQDTLPIKPIIKKAILNIADTVIKTFAIPNRGKYLLLIEIYSDRGLKFCYHDLGQGNKRNENISLSELHYQEFKNMERNPECMRFSRLSKQPKHIEYFANE